MSKKIVCYCHDLTEKDLIRAIEAGYDHIETLRVPTMRPPAEPIPIGWLATEVDRGKDEEEL